MTTQTPQNDSIDPKKVNTWSTDQTAHKSASETLKDVASHIPSTDQIEDKMDQVADELTQKIQWVVTPEISTKTGNIVSAFDRLIDQIQDIISDIVDLIPVADSTNTKDLSLTIPYQESVSRLFIFRRLWLIPQYFIIMIRSVWASILLVLQVLNMLLTGKRNANLHTRLVRFVTHTTKRSSYITGMSDVRPSLFVK